MSRPGQRLTKLLVLFLEPRYLFLHEALQHEWQGWQGWQGCQDWQAGLAGAAGATRWQGGRRKAAHQLDKRLSQSVRVGLSMIQVTAVTLSSCDEQLVHVVLVILPHLNELLEERLLVLCRAAAHVRLGDIGNARGQSCTCLILL